MRILAFLAVLLAAVPSKAATLRQQYVGRSGCDAEFKTSSNDYGIRLDKRSRTRLEAHVFDNKTILTIVQYSDNSDKCGVVHDVVQARRRNDSFVWECVDKRLPHAVVIGTWSGEHARVSGPALEAWRVNLKELKFVRLNVPVTCVAGNYAGFDQGEDLATWAQKRSVHR